MEIVVGLIIGFGLFFVLIAIYVKLDSYKSDSIEPVARREPGMLPDIILERQREMNERGGRLEKAADAVIRQCEINLVKGKDADTSARTLGDIAIEHRAQVALLALWAAVCKTSDLRSIIDPCAYTVGRVVRESSDATLEDICFEIFSKSVVSGSELIVDKFAYTVGEVALRATSNKTRQRSREFVRVHASDTDPLVRRCYAYTERRITQ